MSRPGGVNLYGADFNPAPCTFPNRCEFYVECKARDPELTYSRCSAFEWYVSEFTEHLPPLPVEERRLRGVTEVRVTDDSLLKTYKALAA